MDEITTIVILVWAIFPVIISGIFAVWYFGWWDPTISLP